MRRSVSKPFNLFFYRWTVPRPHSIPIPPAQLWSQVQVVPDYLVRPLVSLRDVAPDHLVDRLEPLELVHEAEPLDLLIRLLDLQAVIVDGGTVQTGRGASAETVDGEA